MFMKIIKENYVIKNLLLDNLKYEFLSLFTYEFTKSISVRNYNKENYNILWNKSIINIFYENIIFLKNQLGKGPIRSRYLFL